MTANQNESKLRASWEQAESKLRASCLKEGKTPVTFVFSFESDWMRGWRNFFFWTKHRARWSKPKTFPETKLLLIYFTYCLLARPVHTLRRWWSSFSISYQTDQCQGTLLWCRWSCIYHNLQDTPGLLVQCRIYLDIQFWVVSCCIRRTLLRMLSSSVRRSDSKSLSFHKSHQINWNILSLLKLMFIE